MLKFDWNFLFEIINLIILFLLMKKFLFKPIKKAVDKRREVLEKDYNDAEAAKAEAEQLRTQYESQLETIEEQKVEAMKESRQKARQEYDRILSSAQEDAKQVREENEKRIAEENAKAIRDSQKEIASLAIQLAEKVVGKNIDGETNNQIFEEFLNSNEGKQDNESNS